MIKMKFGNNHITNLTATVDFNNELILNLQKENKNLNEKLTQLATATARLTKENQELRSAVLDLRCRSMRNNVVINGIPESPREDYEKTEKKVLEFLETNLRMPKDQIKTINIERAHRFAKKFDDKPRPIVVRLFHHKMKEAILSHGKNLAGTKLSVNQQWPQEVAQKRKYLYRPRREAIAAGHKAVIVMDKLYINGQLYRPPVEIQSADGQRR